MALLPILRYPDPRLREAAKPVDKITPEIQELIDNMAETMYDAPGCGLAANQVGVPLRALRRKLLTHLPNNRTLRPGLGARASCLARRPMTAGRRQWARMPAIPAHQDRMRWVGAGGHSLDHGGRGAWLRCRFRIADASPAIRNPHLAKCPYRRPLGAVLMTWARPPQPWLHMIARGLAAAVPRVTIL